MLRLQKYKNNSQTAFISGSRHKNNSYKTIKSKGHDTELFYKARCNMHPMGMKGYILRYRKKRPDVYICISTFYF